MELITRLVTTVVPAPPWWVVASTGAVALLVNVIAVVPQVTRPRQALFLVCALSTIVHEAGHAAAGIVTGGGVWLIEVYTPDSGMTYTWHRSWISSVAISAAGYASPPLAGLAVAAMLHQGQAHTALITTTVAMVLILVVSRDLITVGSVATVGLLAFAALYWGPAWVQGVAVSTESWLLLLGEIPGLYAITANRVRGTGSGHDDADGLADITRIPGVVWIVGWIVLIGWALWRAVPMLWP